MSITATPGRPLLVRLRAYVPLTKPRIVELLLITTVPTMILAADGWPGTGLVAGTVAGGALSAGGANSINNVVDRNIDARMRRTRHRPLLAESATPREALVLGFVLGVAGFLTLWIVAHIVAAILATSALAFYVLIYSLYLKRTTPQNIVIGGAAGAVPALVGWVAVTGSIALPAWLLFAVIFYWTPPHFWALALQFRTDYETADVPMLPVVVGERATAIHIVIYSMIVAEASHFYSQPPVWAPSTWRRRQCSAPGSSLYPFRCFAPVHRPYSSSDSPTSISACCLVLSLSMCSSAIRPNRRRQSPGSAALW